jgi:hypothetical protein
MILDHGQFASRQVRRESGTCDDNLRRKLCATICSIMKKECIAYVCSLRLLN